MRLRIIAVFLFGASFASAAVPLQSVVFASDSAVGDPTRLVAIVGESMHFFKEQGIELRSILWAEAKSSHAAAEFVLLGRPAIDREVNASPGRFKVLAYAVQDAGHPTDAIVVPVRSAALTVAGLRGMKNFFTSFPNSLPLVKQLLAQNGFQDGTVTFSSSAFEFQNGDWEAAYLREPLLSLALAQDRVRILIDGPIFSSRVIDPWPMAAYAFSDDFMKTRPDAAARVAAALDRTLRFIRAEPAEAQAIYRARVTGKFGRELDPRIYTYRRSDEVPAAILQRQSDWQAAQGLVPHRVDVSSFGYRWPASDAAAPSR